MNNEVLESLQRRLGYQFKDITRLKRALTHKSAHHLHNERLEFLGDSIINFIIAQGLFLLYPQANEGDLTRARAALVNKPMLAQVAKELDLGSCILLGQGERKSGGFRRESILADCLEAIIAAIFLDSDMAMVQSCIQSWFEHKMQTIKPSEQLKDPKTRLQEWLQSKQMALPKYEVESVSGEPHQQIFKVMCYVDGYESMEGMAGSRRCAEQIAAQKFMEILHDNSD